MIKKEYEKLIDLVEKGARLEASLEEILQESVVFFEKLRVEFPKADKEEREEMIHMMTTLHARLQEVAKQSAEASGMSEEELSVYAEDPSNFSPEQWRVVQSSRRKLYDSARKLSSAMEEQSRRKGAPGEAKEKEAGATPKKKPTRSKTRRSKKGDWMKS